jgi:hypothetical protein
MVTSNSCNSANFIYRTETIRTEKGQCDMVIASSVLQRPTWVSHGPALLGDEQPEDPTCQWHQYIRVPSINHDRSKLLFKLVNCYNYVYTRERGEPVWFDGGVHLLYKVAYTCTPVCRAPTRSTSWHYCLRKKIRNNQKVPLGSSLGLSLALLSSAHARVAHVDLLVSLYVGSGWAEKYSAI